MTDSKFLQALLAQHKKSIGEVSDLELAKQFVDDLFSFLFVPKTNIHLREADLNKGLQSLKSHLDTLIYSVVNDGNKAQQISEGFIEKLPELYNGLLENAAAFVENDPAAQSIQEVTNAYPGFYAIAVYRFSNELLKRGVHFLPRVFTEYAHSKTGIDIHPGATIGKDFFIDHGTGVVIGETAVIGNNVRIYQGVTIGALNSSKHKTSGKRHPTIEDNVIIYSGATILGGDTVIGHDSVIGGNAWITFSIPAGSLVYHKSEVVNKENFSYKDSVEKILNPSATPGGNRS